MIFPRSTRMCFTEGILVIVTPQLWINWFKNSKYLPWDQYMDRLNNGVRISHMFLHGRHLSVTDLRHMDISSDLIPMDWFFGLQRCAATSNALCLYMHTSWSSVMAIASSTLTQNWIVYPFVRLFVETAVQTLKFVVRWLEYTNAVPISDYMKLVLI